MARTYQVLRQGSNASDAVLVVHRILRVLRAYWANPTCEGRQELVDAVSEEDSATSSWARLTNALSSESRLTSGSYPGR